MLYLVNKSLVKPLLVSICARLLRGPTTGKPFFQNKSEKPCAKGSSGPITTQSILFSLVKSIILFSSLTKLLTDNTFSERDIKPGLEFVIIEKTVAPA